MGPLLLALLALGSSLAPCVARADADTLVPTYAEAQQRAATLAARELETTLRRMPDVLDARVHITPPDLSHLPLDQDAPPPRISAWLSLGGPGPDDASLRALLSGGATGTQATAIEIVRQRAAPAPSRPSPLAAVGPFRVASDSAPWLRGALGVLLATNVILATVIMARRRRSARNTR